MRSADDIKGAIFWNFIVNCLLLPTYCHPFMLRQHRDGSRGGVHGVCIPTPWDDLRLVFCEKKKKSFLSGTPPPGAHHMEPLSPLIFWVNRFPSRFINTTIFFGNALECACRLPFYVRQYYCHFSILIGSFLYQRAKPPQETVLFANLLGKGLYGRWKLHLMGSCPLPKKNPGSAPAAFNLLFNSGCALAQLSQ